MGMHKLRAAITLFGGRVARCLSRSHPPGHPRSFSASWVLAVAVCLLLAPAPAAAQLVRVPPTNWSGTITVNWSFNVGAHHLTQTATYTISRLSADNPLRDGWGDVFVDATVLWTNTRRECPWVLTGSFKGPVYRAQTLTTSPMTLLLAPDGNYRIDNIPYFFVGLTPTFPTHCEGTIDGFYSPLMNSVVFGGGPPDATTLEGRSVIPWAGWPGGTITTTWTLTRGSDLEVLSVVPVQAVIERETVDGKETIKDPDMLVDGKPTVLATTIKSTFDTKRTVDVQITYANPGIQVVGPEPLEVLPGENVYYLPQKTTLRPHGSEFYARVDVDSRNILQEVDKTNNGKTMAKALPVVQTRTLKVLVVPFVVHGETNDPHRCDSGSTYTTFKKGLEEFIAGTYPIGELGIVPNCRPEEVPNAPMKVASFSGPSLWDIWLRLAKAARMNGFDHAIGVMRSGWFRDFGSDDRIRGLIGASPFPVPCTFPYYEILGCHPETNASIIEETAFDENGAHEIAHTWGWVARGHPLESTNPPRHFEKMAVRGYWPSAHREMGKPDPVDQHATAFDFMHPVELAPGAAWISKLTWDFLFDRLKTDPTAGLKTNPVTHLSATVANDAIAGSRDAAVIDISGTVFLNGAVKLDPWYRVTGNLNVQLDAPGDYRLLYLDAAGTTLAETGFGISFQDSLAVPPEESNGGGFSLTVPDVPGTATLLLQHDGITLAERSVSPHAPEIRLLTPQAGETFLTGDPVQVSWQAFDADGDQLHYTVSISQDAGTNWLPLAVDLPADQLIFTVPPNVGSRSAVIRVTATDGINTAVVISDATFTLGDLVPPVITLNGPAAINIESFDLFSDPGATAIDDVAGDLTAALHTSGSVDSNVPGTYTIVYTVDDLAGNHAEASRIITVVDTTPPALTVPADVMAEAASGAGTSVSYPAAGIDRVDGIVPVICAPASESTFAVGVTRVECYTSDQHGNTASASFLVTVTLLDTAPPALTVPADLVVEATSAVGAIATFAAAATDRVDATVAVTCAPASQSTFALGTSRVTCSAADQHGNTASASFLVTVVDTTPPALTVPADMTVEATSAPGAVASYVASGTDGVDGSVSVICAPASQSTFALGTSRVMCSTSDRHGNTASASFLVTVVDTVPSALTVPVEVPPSNWSGTVTTTFHYVADPAQDIAVRATFTKMRDGSATVSFNYLVTATSGCFFDTASFDGPVSSPLKLLMGSAGQDEFYSLELPPVTTVLTRRAPSACADETSMPYTWDFYPLTNGVVAGVVPRGAARLAGEMVSPNGAVRVAWDLERDAGNDLVPPVITLNGPAAINIESFDLFSDPGATAIDDVAGDLTAALHTSGSVDSNVPGTYTIVYTVDDLAGNHAEASRIITVVDTTPPALTVPADVMAEAASGAGTSVSYPAAGIDRVDGIVPVICAPASESTFAVGVTRVECYTSDQHGNTASASFLVTVTLLDTAPPALMVPAGVVVEATDSDGSDSRRCRSSVVKINATFGRPFRMLASL